MNDITSIFITRFVSSVKDVITDGFVVELFDSPHMDNPKYYITRLYNLIDSDINRYETWTLSFTYLLARDLRLVTEFTHFLENQDRRLVFGFLGAY